ncbi:MAG: hypothetical protein C0504_00815 [Candidatus Solibacter sp.]|nr:hypothetical protein [Candidatus Solibacter sp.]
MLWAAPVNPGVTVNSGVWTQIGNNCRGNGTGFCVADAIADSYDGAAHLRVNGANYSASNPSDLTGNTYTGGAASMSGLDVSLQYTFLDSTLMRALATFTNPTTGLISTSFEFESNSGADSSMQFVTTSSGDAIFSAADMWAVVDDGNLSGGDTSTLYVFFGPGAPSTPNAVFNTTTFVGAGNQGVRAQFNLDVAAGQTLRYLFFLGLDNTAAGATALAQQFNSNPGPALLGGLSPSELNSIQNFNFGVSEIPEPSTVAMAAAGLVALLALRRRR